MRIITWNANRKFRWSMLWDDAAVKAMSWDFIMLQETGEPQTNDWTLLDSSTATKWADLKEDEESLLYWVFSYRPPDYGRDVFIVFCRWPGRRKNHLVVITQLRPSAVVNVSNDVAIRPVVALLAEIEVNHQTRNVLVGCIHVVASANAEKELRELTPQLLSHCQLAGAQNWVLVGDFNCDPDVAQGAMKSGVKLPNGGDPVAYAPPWHTHPGTRSRKDYLMANDVSALGPSSSFSKGTARSDHLMVICELKSAKLINLPLRREIVTSSGTRPRRTGNPLLPQDLSSSDSDSDSDIMVMEDSDSDYMDIPDSDTD